MIWRSPTGDARLDEDWCRRCQEFRARRMDMWLCPICVTEKTETPLYKTSNK